MGKTQIVSCVLFTIALIIINTWSIGQIVKSKKTEVRGINTKILPTVKTSPTIITPTIIPTIIQPIFIKQSTLQTKYQYGGWYWRPELNKSQIWIGTDSAGKDIWTDGIPAPTSTPTPLPQKSIKVNTGNSVSDTLHKSMTSEVVSCLFDNSSSPDIPKCP